MKSLMKTRKQKETGEKEVHLLEPVSYTHLDVYKRQGQDKRIPARWGRETDCNRI